MKKSLLLSIAITATATALGQCPIHLTTDLLTNTDQVWEKGYSSTATLADVAVAWQRASKTNSCSIPYQIAYIRSSHPRFGWELPAGVQQNAYRILVASSLEKLKEGEADVWDSGKLESSQCTGIVCGGDALATARIYYWTIAVWDENDKQLSYASPQSFMTSGTLDDEFSRSPLCKTDELPVEMSNGNVQVADFGKAAYGQLRLTISSKQDDTLTIHVGEACKDGKVDRKPGGSIRYTKYDLPVHRGTNTYRLSFKPDNRNAMIKNQGQDVRPVLMPEYIGEVYPFRYCEVESKHGSKVESMVREAVHYRWDENASFFRSSDETLNQVWELCKYSMKMTSFCGVYVDGDRERIPYEADAFINQLSHYCTDREYSMARYTVDHLCHNATWPTEWILQALILAWNDYLYTGDTALLQRNYNTLKARTLTELTQENGLISTKMEKAPKELLERCGFYGAEIRDIVDWPQAGGFGLGKEEAGEADGYKFSEYNTVVNAFHYRALVLMSKIAETVGEEQDSKDFTLKASRHKDAFNRLLLDTKAGCYRDGKGSDHHALHASMAALAFGMVPDKYKKQVLQHIQSRGMACSVYGAQILLDALYEAGADEYALQLMSSKGLRSWYNMLKIGSTVTLEAWDIQFKNNLDWNHAWGAAPANIIPRRLMGIEPIAPGWSKIRVKPQIGSLEWADIKVPTIRGEVLASVKQQVGRYSLDVDIPAGCEAEVWIPCTYKKASLSLDGEKCTMERKENSVVLNLKGGHHAVLLESKTK